MPHRLSQRVVVPVIVASSIFLAIVDGAITTVALPSIGRQFHLPASGLDSVVVVYPVCVGMVMPASAWLGDRFGGKRVVLLSLALFVGASALCGSAQNLGQLVGYRALQGLGGGLLLPAGATLLFRTFSASERVRASRLMIFPQQVAPALAPILGGLLVDGASWRWVFYVNLPVGAAALTFGLLFLDEHRDHAPGRLDVPGLLLSATGLATLMYGVCEGSQQGWGSAPVDTALAVGALLLGAAVVVQLRTAEPVLKLRLFTDRLFRDTNLICLVGYIPIMGAMFLGPLFLQEAQGRSALDSGTSTFTEAFGVLLTVQVAGALYARVGPRLIIAAGMAGVTGVLLLLSTCDLHTGLWTFRLYMFLLGVSMGGLFGPMVGWTLSPNMDPRMVEIVQHFWENRKIGRAMLAGGSRPVVLSILTERFEAGLADLQVVSPDASPKLAAAYLAAGTLAVLETWLAGRAPGSAVQVATALHAAGYAAARAWTEGPAIKRSAG